MCICLLGINKLVIGNFELLELVEIVRSSGFVNDFLIVFIGELGVVDGVGSFDAFSDVVVKFFHEVVLVGFDFFGDFACVRLEEVEWLKTLLVVTLLITDIVTKLTWASI